MILTWTSMNIEAYLDEVWKELDRWGCLRNPIEEIRFWDVKKSEKGELG